FIILLGVRFSISRKRIFFHWSPAQRRFLTSCSIIFLFRDLAPSLLPGRRLLLTASCSPSITRSRKKSARPTFRSPGTQYLLGFFWALLFSSCLRSKSRWENSF